MGNSMRTRHGALALIALVIALGASGCVGWEVSKAPPKGQEVGTGGGASLSPAGAERIKETARAEFDWSSGHLRLADVGIPDPDDHPQAVSALDRDRPIAVTVTAPHTTIDVPAERIFPYVEAGSDELGELWLSIRAGSDAELASLMREYSAIAGAENDGSDAWIESFESDPEATCNTLGYNTAVGTASGLQIWLEASCDWDPEPRRFLSVHLAPL